MGKLAEIKTKETDFSVDEFLNNLKDEQQKKDCLTLINLMQKASHEAPKMWGNSIIGFGLKRYKSPKTGREVDWFKIGFSPRKSKLSLHLVLDLQVHSTSLEKLGKHKAGVGCLYINKLDDVEINILEELISSALKGK